MVVSKRLTIGSTPVELTDGFDAEQQFAIRVVFISGTGTLNLGGADLDSSNGHVFNLPQEIPSLVGKLYGVAPDSSVDISILIYSV